VIRVAVADDSYLIREAVREILAPVDEVDVVAVCEDADALWEAIERDRPDVVLADVRMPPSGADEGIRLANRLRKTHPEVGVVVLSQYADPHYGLDLVHDGAERRAYLLKERVHDRRALLAAIEVVAHGGSMIDPQVVRQLIDADHSPLAALSPREREVLAEMASGKSNGAIAESLVLTKRAVEKHVGAIFLKLGLHDEEVVSRRVAAVLLYLAERRTPEQ
jgi:DNA-binding NarL/FixJ family response regulator